MVENAPSPPQEQKRKKTLLFVTLFFLIAGGSLFFYWYGWLRFEVYTDDAYVAGNAIPLTPLVGGVVSQVYVDSTDWVEEGELLVELDATEAQVALDKSIADLGLALRRAVSLFDQVREAREALRIAQAQALLATQEVERRQPLLPSGAISIEEESIFKTNEEAAKATVSLKQAQLESAEAQVTGTTVTSHPSVLFAMEAVRMAWLTRWRCNLYAPARGMIAERTVQVGEWVTPALPLLSVVPLDNLWIEANFKEVQLSSLRPGQWARIRADIYGGSLPFTGRIVEVGAGTGSVFSALPPQNATGNWIKIVQRVPVRLLLDLEELRRHPLRLGLSVEVTVDLKHPALPLPPPLLPRYTTQIFQKQLSGVEDLITATIEANVPEAYRPPPAKKALP